MAFYSYITVFIKKVSKDKSPGKALRGKNIIFLEPEHLSPKLSFKRACSAAIWQ